MYLSRSSRRRGKVVVVVALALTAVVGYTAIALEGGLMMDNQRRTQTAADTAALAAAVSLFDHYQNYQGKDHNGLAKEAALNTAKLQGYKNDGKESTVTVHIPPATGDHADKPGYAEVVVEYSQDRYLSRLFGSQRIKLTARSVAQGRWAAYPAGIMALDTAAQESIKAGGGGQIIVKGADIIANSNNDQAIGTDGTGTIIRVTDGGIVRDSGGIKANSNIDGTLLTYQPPVPDPLAYLPYPPKPGMKLTANAIPGNNAAAKPYLAALGIPTAAYKNYKVYILEPGRYDQMPNFNNADVVIFKQASANGDGGVYYLNDCGLVSTGATLALDTVSGTTGGIMFFNDPVKGNAHGIKITGGKVNLSGLTSGPWTGMLLFQRRDADEPVEITGQGNMKLYGTFYAAGAAIKVAGSDSTGLDVLGSQYISRTFEAQGNGQMILEWGRMAARQRRIGLVE